MCGAGRATETLAFGIWTRPEAKESPGSTTGKREAAFTPCCSPLRFPAIRPDSPWLSDIRHITGWSCILRCGLEPRAPGSDQGWWAHLWIEFQLPMRKKGFLRKTGSGSKVGRQTRIYKRRITAILAARAATQGRLRSSSRGPPSIRRTGRISDEGP